MKYCLAAILFLALVPAAFADDAAPKSTTVGGGVNNPWRDPFRTAATLPPRSH